MGTAEIERYERLHALDGRVARAAAELRASRETADPLSAPLREQLATLADELEALRLLISNEVERAWNAAELDARRARRGELMGRINDAVSAETTVPDAANLNQWPRIAPADEG